MVPINYHWQVPLQAPCSSACKGDKDGMAIDLLDDPGTGVKMQFSGTPQRSMEENLRANSLISPSHSIPLQ